MTLGFIGFGNMALAISAGVIESGILQADQIFAYDICTDKLNAFRREHDVIAADSIKSLVESCDIVFLSVKPQNFGDVLSEISECNISDVTFVSIAAGISIKKIKSYIGDASKVVRVMPNTPLLLGCGATAACRCENTSDEEFKTVCSLFECSGTLEVFTESKMDEIISVNGSSPAYLFLFAKAVCNYADSCGIDYDAAKRLFAQTMIGSAKMIVESGDDLQTLIDKVTSKGGTTAKALDKFYDAGFESIIFSAMDACTQRAKELGKE